MMNATVLSLMLAAVIASPAKTSTERSTRIYVRTTPPGASIHLDGKELGTSDGLFLVPPGVRKITLEMDGYDPEAKTVDVTEGWITRVEVRMVKQLAGKTSDRDAGIEEIKHMLARDTKKLDELLQSHGKQDPMVRLLEARIQAWKQILEDPSVEGTLERLDERAAEHMREIETAVARALKRETSIHLDLVRTIHDLDDGQGQEAIDLDTGTMGRVYDLPKEFEDWNRGQRERWLRDQGIDLIADFAANQWGLGFVQSAITLLPAGDLDPSEVGSRTVNNLLAERDDERMGTMELHHEGDIAFVLLPKEPVLPVGFVFETSEGMKGFLQILDLNKEEPRSVKLRWQPTSWGSGGTPLVAPVGTRKRLSEDRKRHLEAVRQLAVLAEAAERYRLDAGEYPSPPRGLKALLEPPANLEHPERWHGPYLNAIPKEDPWGNSYLYGCDPQGTQVTFASNGPDGKPDTADDIFLPAGGLNLEYGELKTKPEASAQADAKPAIEGVLEFRVAANQEEAKEYSEDGTALGWYECTMEDTKNLVTRQHEGRTQALLWQTPEKSMTRGDGQGKKWQVIEVSVIAEPDKPGRVGVVFDEEGGRRLKKLTAENIGRQMAILVDGRVVNCPTIRSPISSHVEITGNFSKAELNRLATALQVGMELSRPKAPDRDP